MAKKNKSSNRTKQRRTERKAAQKRQTMINAGIALVVVVIAAVLLINLGNEAALEVTPRMELDPILGNPDAPITIIEYAAYGCEACKQWHEAGVAEQILEEFPDQVRFIYRDIPIIMPDYSQRTAEVAQCALDQGNEEFWLLHDAIFERSLQGSTTPDEMIQYGAGLGLDVAALQSCYDAETHRDTVRYDLQRGRELGVNATPTWFINGERIFQASPNTLRQRITSELARLNS